MESKNLIFRDGFRVVKTHFIVPSHINQLDRQTKRKVTICNLFINHRMAIPDVARVLDESYSRAIAALIEQGVVEDRRRLPRNVSDDSKWSNLRSRLKQSS